MRRSLALVCLFMTCLMLVGPGCAPRKVRVSGKFVKKGVVQTFSESDYVMLQFVPADPDDARRTYSATIDRAAGTYEVEIMSGKYRISFFVPPAPSSKASPGGPAGPPLVKKPTAAALDGTIYDFTSNTTQDIMVP